MSRKQYFGEPTTACTFFEENSTLNTSLILSDDGFKNSEFLVYNSNDQSAIIRYLPDSKWTFDSASKCASFQKITKGILHKLNQTNINRVRSYLEPVFDFDQSLSTKESVTDLCNRINNEIIIRLEENVEDYINSNLDETDFNALAYETAVVMIRDLENEDIVTFLSAELESHQINGSNLENLEYQLEIVVKERLDGIRENHKIESAPPLTAKTVMGSAPDNTEISSEMEM